MDYKPSLLSVLVSRLHNTRGRWPELERASGVPYRTIQNIAQGVVSGPSVNTVETLLHHLDQLDAASDSAA
jgi:hypothetical protein